jgi:hypothetical protein
MVRGQFYVIVINRQCINAKLLKRYLAKSDHKHRFQDFTDASRDKNGKFNVLVRPQAQVPGLHRRLQRQNGKFNVLVRPQAQVPGLHRRLQRQKW